MSRNKLDLKKYVNKCVALTYPDNKVVGSGETLAETEQTAARRGCQKPFFYKVPLDAHYQCYEVRLYKTALLIQPLSPPS
jgi:hypothetical protein